MLSRGYLMAFALASTGCAWTPKPYADDPHFRAGQTTLGHAISPLPTGPDARPEPAPPPEDDDIPLEEANSLRRHDRRDLD